MHRPHRKQVRDRAALHPHDVTAQQQTGDVVAARHRKEVGQVTSMPACWPADNQWLAWAWSPLAVPTKVIRCPVDTGEVDRVGTSALNSSRMRSP